MCGFVVSFVFVDDRRCLLYAASANSSLSSFALSVPFPCRMSAPLIIDLGFHTIRTSKSSYASLLARPQSQLSVLPCDSHNVIVDKSQLLLTRIGQRGVANNFHCLNEVLRHVLATEREKGGWDGRGDIVIMHNEFDWMIGSFPWEELFKGWNLGAASPSVTTVMKSTGVGYERDKLRVVVDMGFSGCRITCCLGDKVVPESHVRISVGGRMLTNVVREVGGYCWVGGMDYFVGEGVMIEGVSGPVCLPDYVKRGKVVRVGEGGTLEGDEEGLKEEDVVVNMGGYKDVIKNAIFEPRLIGLNEIGVVEGIVESVQRVHEHCWGELYENVIIVGGLSKFEGTVERVGKDLRSLVDVDYNVSVKSGTEKDGIGGVEKYWMEGSRGGLHRGLERGMTSEGKGKGKEKEKEKDDQLIKKEVRDDGEEEVEEVAEKTKQMGKEKGKETERGKAKGKVKGKAKAKGKGKLDSAEGPTSVAKGGPSKGKRKRDTSKKPKPAAAKKVKASQPLPTYNIGDLVEGRWQRQAIWYYAVVVALGRDRGEGDVYDLSYEDGDFDRALEAKYVRPRRAKGRRKKL